MKIYNNTCDMFEKWKSRKNSTKGEHLLKHQLGHIPTVPVMAGNEREEKPPWLPTPRMDALASARQKCRGYEQSADWRENVLV